MCFRNALNDLSTMNVAKDIFCIFPESYSTYTNKVIIINLIDLLSGTMTLIDLCRVCTLLIVFHTGMSCFSKIGMTGFSIAC